MNAVPGRVFVTGAGGFIGRALSERYRASGAEVAGVDLVADPSAGVVAGDVAKPGDWQRQAAGADLVIHTAAYVGMRSAPGIWEANVLGTRTALDAAVAGGATRFVHFSSIVVFSFEFPREVDERYPLRANGVPYVDTKVASEQVVLAAHAAGEIECTIVRPGDVYGPGSRPWTVIPVEELRARRLILPAMGRGLMAPTYVDNLVDGVALAAASPEAAGQVFTLTDGLSTETRDFFERYARMLGRRRVPSAPTRVVRGLARAGGAVGRLRGQESEVTPAAIDYLARRGTYSIAKARKMLGHEPALSLDEGMARTEAWLREQKLV